MEIFSTEIVLSLNSSYVKVNECVTFICEILTNYVFISDLCAVMSSGAKICRINCIFECVISKGKEDK